MPAYVFESILELGPNKYSQILKDAEQDITTIRTIAKNPDKLKVAHNYLTNRRECELSSLRLPAKTRSNTATDFIIRGSLDLLDVKQDSFAARWVVAQDDDSGDDFNSLAHQTGVPQEVEITDDFFLTIGTRQTVTGLFKLTTLVTTDPIDINTNKQKNDFLSYEPYFVISDFSIKKLSDFMMSLKS